MTVSTRAAVSRCKASRTGMALTPNASASAWLVTSCPGAPSSSPGGNLEPPRRTRALGHVKGTPGVLIAVIGATAIVQVFGLETRSHVSVWSASSGTARVLATLGRPSAFNAGGYRRPRGCGCVIRRY